ncbi:MAG: hypothetical protein LBR47_01580, partial [Spirochaetaceae bacterium]|nr:hypothetical protein [Spirochaetaceae bacterium]
PIVPVDVGCYMIVSIIDYFSVLSHIEYIAGEERFSVVFAGIFTEKHILKALSLCSVLYRQ